MAHDETITTKVLGDARARKPPDHAMAVSIGCIAQILGVSALVAGCGLVLVVLVDFRRPLRYLGIRLATAPDLALLLIGLGLLVMLLGNMPVQEFLKSATRQPSPATPTVAKDDKNDEGETKALPP